MLLFPSSQPTPIPEEKNKYNITYLQTLESGDPYQPTECMGDNQPQSCLKLPPIEIRLN